MRIRSIGPVPSLRWVAVVLAGCLLSQGATRAADTSLLDAAEANDRASVLQLLAKGANPNTLGADRSSALMYASANGDLELVRALIKAGADAKLKNEFGSSAIAEAAIIGSAPILDALIKAGADPNTKNPEGETPLMAAARSGRVDAAKVLLDAKADVNAKETWGGQSALMWAAAQSQAEMVKLLVSRGADLDARGVIRQWERKILGEPRPKDMNKGGFTALIYAAREGCIECARNLVAAGADKDIGDPDNVTALNMALMNMHFEFAAFMVKAGADLDKWDLYGRSPVYMAADVSTLPMKGNGAVAVIPSPDSLTAVDVGRLMLEAGANPNIQLKRRPPYRDVPQDRGGDNLLSQGATPLVRAARAGDAPFVALLLKYHALVDLPTKEKVTPLMAAAGADLGSRATRGRERTDEGVLATMKLLVDGGANVNAKMVMDRGGGRRGSQVPSANATPHQTALHIAASRGHHLFVEFLAKNGADLSAKDGNGRTALELARSGGGGGRGGAQPQGESFSKTVALLQSLMAAK